METQPLEREAYFGERRALVQAEIQQASAFDKAILTLAAGALGLSLTFIREIAPNYDHRTVVWLCLAWGGFIASLLATLASFQLSQVALRRQRDLLDAQYRGDELANQTRLTGLAKHVNRLNWGSLVAFILGTVLLAVFAAINL